MTAITFALHSLASGQFAGLGLLCPDARYVSILHAADGSRLDRRHPSAEQWKAVLSEVRDGVPAAHLDADSAIAGAFGASGRFVVRKLNEIDVAAEPEDIAGKLDALLKSQGVNPMLRLRQSRED